MQHDLYMNPNLSDKMFLEFNDIKVTNQRTPAQGARHSSAV